MTTPTTEEELVIGLKAGNEKAFSTIYSLYHSRVFSFCLKILPLPDDASEILQRVFVALWEQRLQIDESQPLGAYIFSITKYMAHRELKQRIHRRAALESITTKSTVLRECTKDEVLFNDLVRVLHAIINQLPERRKQIFTLSRFDDLSYREIATKLNISENTVDTQIRRALNFIQKEYQKYFK